jgi:hypothetical protein
MLALIAALMFLIAIIIELARNLITIDLLFQNAGLLLVALFLAGIGAREFRFRR